MKKLLVSAVLAGLLCAAIVNSMSFTHVSNGNEYTPLNSAQLGEKLFADVILSGDYSVSCASCHKPEFAFSDTAAFSLGVNEHLTGRNTPTAMYLEESKIFFWDGRAGSLEEQAKGPITNPKEMNLTVKEAVVRLNKSAFYKSSFKKIFGRDPDSAALLKSLADFERTLSFRDSPYDRFLKGDDNAISDAAKRGFTLFFRVKTCANTGCHAGQNFAADSLVNVGLFSDQDKGLFDLTGNKDDVGKFKSPTLRNIAITSPYMHNAKFKTLREVIVFYNDKKNFPDNANIHPNLLDHRRTLSDAEIDDLVEFLKSLTDYRYLNPSK